MAEQEGKLRFYAPGDVPTSELEFLTESEKSTIKRYALSAGMIFGQCGISPEGMAIALGTDLARVFEIGHKSFEVLSPELQEKYGKSPVEGHRKYPLGALPPFDLGNDDPRRR